ncbi:MAG: hypothetical protein ACREFP_09115 [Acetobacteraceae bacterium]
MTEIDATALVARIEQLERRLCRLRRMVGGTMLAVVIAVAATLSFGGRVLADPEHAGIIKAREFEVIGPGGKVWADLSAFDGVNGQKSGGAALSFFDQHGNIPAMLSSFGGFPMLHMMSRNGVADVRPGLVSVDDANPALSISIGNVTNDDSDLEDAFLRKIPYGIQVDDHVSGSSASLEIRRDGLPSLAVGDGRNPHSAASLGIQKGGNPSLWLIRGGGGVVSRANLSEVNLAVGEGARPYLMFSLSGQPRLWLGSSKLGSKSVGGSVRTPESSITALDKKGKVVAVWPTP